MLNHQTKNTEYKIGDSLRFNMNHIRALKFLFGPQTWREDRHTQRWAISSTLDRISWCNSGNTCWFGSHQGPMCQQWSGVVVICCDFADLLCLFVWLVGWLGGWVFVCLFVCLCLCFFLCWVCMVGLCWLVGVFLFLFKLFSTAQFVLGPQEIINVFQAPRISLKLGWLVEESIRMEDHLTL